MAQYTLRPASLNWLEPAEQPSTLEEKQLTNSESQISPLQQELSGEFLQAKGADAPWFEQIELQDLVQEDYYALDRARRAAYYVYTVAEFADALKKGTYDMFKFRGLPGCLCLILTSFERFPRHQFLLIHYLGGRNCKPHLPVLRRAVFELAERMNCSEVIYHTVKDHYAKFLGGEKLATMWRLKKDEEFHGSAERANGHFKE